MRINIDIQFLKIYYKVSLVMIIALLKQHNKISPQEEKDNNLMFTFEFNNNDFSNLEIKNNILEGGREYFNNQLYIGEKQ